jgi:hypothetical protein
MEAKNFFDPTYGGVGCFLGKVIFESLPVIRISIK